MMTLGSFVFNRHFYTLDTMHKLGHSNEVTLYVNGMYEPYRVGLSNEDNLLWIKLYSRKTNFVGIDEDRKINSYILNLLFTKLIDGFELGISK